MPTILQELVRSLRTSMQRSIIMEEEEEDVDNETIALRLLDNLKFQVLFLVRVCPGKVGRFFIHANSYAVKSLN